MKLFLERILYHSVTLYVVIWLLVAALAGGMTASVTESWEMFAGTSIRLTGSISIETIVQGFAYGFFLLILLILGVFFRPINLLGLLWPLVFGWLTLFAFRRFPAKWIASIVILAVVQTLLLTGIVIFLHAPDIRIIDGNDTFIELSGMDAYDSPSLLDVLWQYGGPCFIASFAASYVLARADS